LVLIVAISTRFLVSEIVFEGHTHPDEREYIWQDILIITTIVVVYVFYIGKVILIKEKYN